jgi:hypothetical protein
VRARTTQRIAHVSCGDVSEALQKHLSDGVFFSAGVGAFVLGDYKDPGLWVAIGSVFTGWPCSAVVCGGLCSVGDRRAGNSTG